MKNALLIILLLTSGHFFAQERNAASSKSEERTEQLNQLVQLNESQAAEAKTIYSNSEAKENAVNANSALSAADKKAELEKIKQEEATAINGLLNESQRSILNENPGSEPQKANINTSRSNIKQKNND